MSLVKNRVSTLVDLLRLRASEEGEKPAFVFLADGEDRDEELSFAGLDRRARAVAAALQQSAAIGDRALLVYPPGLDFIAGFFGCLYAGVVAVPTYPPRARRNLDRFLSVFEDSGARHVLTSTALRGRLEGVRRHHDRLGAASWLTTDALVEEEAATWETPVLDGGSPAFLQYTSGSTSAPKGVVVRHANLLHNQEVIRRAFELTPESIILSWLPLYHDMGLIGTVMQPLYLGARGLLMAPVAFLQKPLRWLQAISVHRVTTSGGPNFAYELCMDRISPKERRQLDLSTWSVAFNGAEPVRAETLGRFAETFASCGFDRGAFFPCYGLAEATLMVSGGRSAPGTREMVVDAEAFGAGRVEPAADGRAGKTLVGSGTVAAGQSVVIVDPSTRRPSAPGAVGEIWVQGPSVAAGYWGRPEESAAAFGARLARSASRFEDGAWLRTGDLGFRRGAELFVTGRIKDLIILRGRNYYPQDFELSMDRCHPGVRPGCGVAFSVEEEMEERLVLVQEVDRRVDDTGEVLEAVREAVAREHGVYVWEVVLVPPGGVPRTSSGKVQRRACRALYLDEALEAVARTGAGLGTGEEEALLGLEEIRALDPGQRLRAVEGLVRHLVAKVGGVDPRRVETLAGAGIDSLRSVELGHRIEAALDVVVDPARLFSEASVPELAVEICGQLDTGGGSTETAEGTVAQVIEPGTLTPGQAALFSLEAWSRDTAALHIGGAFRVLGALDGEALRRAAVALTRRHGALRSRFCEEDGVPRRRSQRGEAVDFELRRGPGTVAEREAWIDDQLVRPFDLERGPLLRLGLWLGEGEGLLVLTVHHLVADLWSLAVMARDLDALYRQQKDAGSAGLPPLTAGYGDFVREQQTVLAGRRGDRLWAYWTERLAGVPLRLELPSDRPRPRSRSYRGGAVTRRLSAGVTGGLRRLADAREVTPFTVLLAIFQALLARLSNQQVVAVGSPAASRPRAAWAEVVGYFTNPVVLVGDLADDPSLEELLDRNRVELMGALAHQELPFPLLADRLQPERDPRYPHLVQALLVFHDAIPGFGDTVAAVGTYQAGVDWRLDDVELRSLARRERGAQFDLTLVAGQLEDELSLALVYDRDLFDGTTAGRWLGAFEVLLAEAVARPRQPLSHLSSLPASAKHQLVVEWAAGAAGSWDMVAELDLPHRRVERWARETPDAVALEWGERSLSYAELSMAVEALARRLAAAGVGVEDTVAVLLERSPEWVVAQLAIWAAGAAYMPLDPGYPPERLAYMSENARPALVLTRAGLAGRLSRGAAQELVIDGWSSTEDAPEHPVTAQPRAENLAYVIYTSGSTGRPKGVEVSRRGLAYLAVNARTLIPVPGRHRLLQYLSPSFDGALWDVVTAFTRGGTLVLAEALALLPGPELVDVLRRRRISHGVFPPSVLGALGSQHLPDLRCLAVAGEACSAAIADRWQAGRELWNFYGPTEASVWVTSERLRAGSGTPAIGRAVAGATVQVLDERLRPVPVGVAGELCVGGDRLARDYLRRAALTASSFVPDPGGSTPGARLYRTGDRVRFLADGRLDFLGRVDEQVKLRGFRIELGEVEAALREHPEIAETVVILDAAAADHQRLVAYAVPTGVTGPPNWDLWSFLEPRLPRYMIPAAVVVLDALPLTSHGKVDRAALPPAEQGVPLRAASVRVAPRGEVEEALAEVWCRVLHLDTVGIHDNFFELGGDSILSLQVTHQAARRGLRLLPRMLFEHQTIAALAVVAEPLVDAAEVEVESVEAEVGEVPLTPIQRWFFGQRLADPDHWNQWLTLSAAMPLEARLVARSLGLLARHHAALRARFSTEAGHRRCRLEAPVPALPVPTVDLGGLTDEGQERVLEQVEVGLQQVFDLTRGPTLAAVLCKRPEIRGDWLVLAAHHLVVDGVSWRILIEDLERVYLQLAAATPVRLPAGTTSWRRWAEGLDELVRGGSLEAETPVWRRLAKVPALRLPRKDDARPGLEGSAVVTRRALDPALTEVLVRDLPRRLRVRVEEVLLAALVRSVPESWSGASVPLFVEGVGRTEILEEADVHRTVGWFTALYPVLLPASREGGWAHLLLGVKEALRAIPRRGAGYGLLSHPGPAVEPAGDLDQAPRDLLFNYLGRIDLDTPTAQVVRRVRRFGGSRGPTNRRPFSLQLDGSLVAGRLEVDLGYSPEELDEAAAESFADTFLEQLTSLARAAPGLAPVGLDPSDFPLLRVEAGELRRILGDGVGVEDIYPLSPMQEGMLAHALEEPDSWAYVQQLVCHFDAALDTDRLRRAWSRLVERHPVLRTSFLWQVVDGPLQLVTAEVPLPWREIDGVGLSGAGFEGFLESFLRRDREQGFQLDRAPLFRLTLIRRPDAAAVLVWTHHHLLLDGWCLPILLRELEGFYRGALLDPDEDPTLPEPAPFRRYVEWLQGLDPAPAEAFWRRQLAGFRQPSSPRLPPPEEPGAVPYGERRGTLGPALSEAVEEIARRARVTPGAVFTAGWGLVLARFHGGDDVVLGTVLSGRSAPIEGIESMIGLLINTLPLRLEVSPALEGRVFLEEVHRRQAALQAFEHVSLGRIRKLAEVPSEQPLFESLLVIENYPRGGLEAAAASLGVVSARAVEWTNFPLTVTVLPNHGHGFGLELAWERRLYDETDALRLLAALRHLLVGLTEEPERRLVDLDDLSSAQRWQLVGEWNASPGPTAWEPVSLSISTRARSHPGDLALVAGDRELTYGELQAAVEVFAARLGVLGVRGRPVAVCLERSVEQLVAFLAVLWSGACYLPLDPTFPPARRGEILEDAAPAALVTARSLAAGDDGWTGPTVWVDEGSGTSSAPGVRQPWPDVAPQELAYVIYTSGSTGRPKGVQIPHAALSAFVAAARSRYGFGPRDRVLQFSSPTFDAAVEEIFVTLTSGGTLVLRDEAMMASPQAFAAACVALGVTVLDLPTGFWHRLTLDLEDDEWRALTTLRLAVVGGDRVLNSGLEVWQKGPGARVRLLNSYGPTEATVVATACELTDYRGRPGREIPIGRPLAGVRAYVLDRRSRLAPFAVPGELCLAGPGLARGYLRRPAETADRFRPDPFAPVGGERLYRTGDLVRAGSDGEIEFLGRVDHQVKLRGFRIEPREIEAALSRHPAVVDAVVVARTKASGDRWLVAYVTAAEGAKPGVPELRAHLEDVLPAFMVPGAFAVLDHLPLTAIGKVDLDALPEPQLEIDGEERVFVAPETEIEQVLAGIWSETLGVATVGTRDDFFSLGGDSILALQVAARAQREGLAVSPAQMMAHPVLADLARRVQHKDGAEPSTGEAAEGEVPLAPIQRWFFDQGLEHPHHFNMGVAVECPAAVPAAALDRAWRAVEASHGAFRLRFEESAGGWRQYYAEAEPRSLVELDLGGLTEAAAETAAADLTAAAQGSLDLARGPVLRSLLLRFAAPRSARLLLIAHHLVIDAVSWRILLTDLARVWADQDGSRAVRSVSPVPGEATSYKGWVTALERRAALPSVVASRSFWSEVVGDPEATPGLLESLGGRQAGRFGDAAKVLVRLGGEDTRKLLTEVHGAYNTTVDDLLLAALVLAGQRRTGHSELVLEVEGHGRGGVDEGLDVSRTVGWFTAIYPLRLRAVLGDLGATVKAVKEHRRRASGGGLDFGLLRYLRPGTEPATDLALPPPASVLFNYLGQLDGVFTATSQLKAGISEGPHIHPDNRRSHALEINAWVDERCLSVEWTYDGRSQERAAVEDLATVYRESLEDLIRHCSSPEAGGFTPSDFPEVDLNQRELDELLSDIESFLGDVP